MAQKKEWERGRADAGDQEADDHVADAADAGSGAYLSEFERARPDPPQPPPRNYSGTDERVEHAPAEPATATADAEEDDATGGDAWNHALGDNTSAGMWRLLGAVGLFILISASVFWLIAG